MNATPWVAVAPSPTARQESGAVGRYSGCSSPSATALVTPQCPGVDGLRFHRAGEGARAAPPGSDGWPCRHGYPASCLLPLAALSRHHVAHQLRRFPPACTDAPCPRPPASRPMVRACRSAIEDLLEVALTDAGAEGPVTQASESRRAGSFATTPPTSSHVVLHVAVTYPAATKGTGIDRRSPNRALRRGAW